MTEARTAGVRVALDAEGERLRLALESQPDVVKVNASEASEILGVPTARRDEAMAAAQKLRELAGGDGHVGIVTRGADGVVVCAPDGALYEGVLYVRGRYPVGSGDAFLAGLVVALDGGDRLGRGVAAGAGGGDRERRAAGRRPARSFARRSARRAGDGPTRLMPDEIRRVGADEGRELRDLRLRALLDAPDAFTVTYDEGSSLPDAYWTDWATELAEGGPSFGLVAEREGRWIGMAVGAPHRDHTGDALLYGMWVDPLARGAGVARGLVEGVVAWARSSGFPVLWLRVALSNDAAVRLYTQCGFTDAGLRLPLREGSDIDTMSMTIDLSA